ncbi:indolin-2-one monooxygenase-like [Zingiber officinale]|uniref:indolin-2-one monooxygenase-like n=1 Tax=Zingiber officinale TaxID=94328 RepID=UPI001C4C2306|nr:indolin-2-one monooxygenase-like [Zingiber officinale]
MCCPPAAACDAKSIQCSQIQQERSEHLPTSCGLCDAKSGVRSSSTVCSLRNGRCSSPVPPPLSVSLPLQYSSQLADRHQNHRRLLPSPPSFPILGHLHLLNSPIHCHLAAISADHGPVVLLRFGSRPVLLVSSSSAVEECFTVHDVAFANRPRFLAGKILGYDFTAILWAPYGSRATSATSPPCTRSRPTAYAPPLTFAAGRSEPSRGTSSSSKAAAAVARRGGWI